MAPTKRLEGWSDAPEEARALANKAERTTLVLARASAPRRVAEQSEESVLRATGGDVKSWVRKCDMRKATWEVE